MALATSASARAQTVNLLASLRTFPSLRSASFDPQLLVDLTLGIKVEHFRGRHRLREAQGFGVIPQQNCHLLVSQHTVSCKAELGHTIGFRCGREIESG